MDFKGGSHPIHIFLTEKDKKRSKRGTEGGAQWANLGLHEDILNQYCYFMYFQPNFHVRTLYKHCVCVFLVFLCLRLRIFVKCALKTEFSQD